MSTDVILQIDCTGLEQSSALAEQLGGNLRGQEVIELVSDLGGGKTTFTKGLAKGIDSTDTVTSPSFTLNNVYRGQELTMYHFDFYRLFEPGILREELAEILTDQQAVTVIEWGGIIEDVLPQRRITVSITATGENERHYELGASQELAYALEGIVK